MDLGELQDHWSSGFQRLGTYIRQIYCFCLFTLFQFEYQQAQLEAEVENLSWKVERAEITDRGVRI